MLSFSTNIAFCWLLITRLKLLLVKRCPINDENVDYQDVLAWVAAGNTIEEAD